MHKLLIYFLTLGLLSQGIVPVLARAERIKKKPRIVSYDLKTDSFKEEARAKVNEDKVYLRVSKKDFKQMRKQALLSASLLQRIRDLERLYKNVNTIVKTIVSAIDLIKKFINFDDLDLDFSSTNDDFEHISGVIMSPGFVEFEAKLNDPTLSFDELKMNSLFMDIYFNRNLFTIDHIESDGVLGTEAKNISLPKKNQAAKARLELPISDVLASSVKFKVYLAPLNPRTIKVGQKTKLTIKYYKRIAKNEDGERIAPVTYDFAEASAREVKVSVSKP